MKLINSHRKLEPQIQDSELTASLILALERTNTPLFDLSNMIHDISTEFKTIELEEIQKAIRNGSLGKYGRTYKFSTQEVCIWIREYLEDKKNNRLNI